mgnify:CR=1 FL=1
MLCSSQSMKLHPVAVFLAWLGLALSIPCAVAKPAEVQVVTTRAEASEVVTQVHITIDDLPWMIEAGRGIPATTGVIKERNKKLQHILSEHQVEVSVFFNCARVRPGDESIQTWLDGGHIVGNHTWSHARLGAVGPASWLQDAKRCHDFLEQAMGVKPVWLRYPYLDYGRDSQSRDLVTKKLAAMGVRTAPVTVATSEWLHAYIYRKAKRTDDAQLEQQVVEDWHQHMDASLQAAIDAASLVPGRPVPQTVLVHMNELVIDELGVLIERWKKHKVRFIGLEQAMSDPVFEQDNLFEGSAGLSWLWRIRGADQYGEYWFGTEQGRVQERFGNPESVDKGAPGPGQ